MFYWHLLLRSQNSSRVKLHTDTTEECCFGVLVQKSEINASVSTSDRPSSIFPSNHRKPGNPVFRPTCFTPLA